MAQLVKPTRIFWLPRHFPQFSNPTAAPIRGRKANNLGFYAKFFQNIVLNLKKNETFEDQQKQGKRPRTSLKKVIANNNIEPIMEININSLLQAETKKQSKTLFNYLKTINEKIRKILNIM